MKSCFFIFTILLALSTTISSLGTNRIIKRLNEVSKQLDRIELRFNNSFKSLWNKIDVSNRNIINSMKAQSSGRQNSYSNISQRPISALLIIDVQNDFIDGSLSLKNCPSKHNGEEVVPIINDLIDTANFDVIVYSYDWHPTNHISFFDNLPLRSHLLSKNSVPFSDLKLYSKAIFSMDNLPDMEQTLWPRHCVQNSSGAELHRNLKLIDDNDHNNTSVIHIYKGKKPHIDSYSAFWDNLKLSETELNKKLKDKGVTKVFVTGLATDWCVYSTAMHAIEYGYETFIIEDACRGVDEKTITERLDDFKKHNGYVIQSDQVYEYVK